MPRIVTAHVELEDGSDFEAEIANLTPSSVFVKTSERLRFRARVTVTFFSVSIQGELAFVSRAEPKGAVIVFEPTPEVRRLIEARIPEIDVLAEEDEVPPEAPDEVEVTDFATFPSLPMPELDPEVPRTEVVRTSPLAAPVALPEADQTGPLPDHLGEGGAFDTASFELEAIHEVAFGEDETHTGAPLTQRTVRPRGTTRADRPRFPAASDDTKDAAPSDDLPRLDDDGATVRFATREQYRAQHDTNIKHGAIVVRSKPLTVGAERKLALVLPGLTGRYELTAKVALNAGGTVGFTIQSLDRHAAELAKLAARPTRPRRVT